MLLCIQVCKYLFKSLLSLILAEFIFEYCHMWVAWLCVFIQLIYMNTVWSICYVQNARPGSRDTKMDKLGPFSNTHQKEKSLQHRKVR